MAKSGKKENWGKWITEPTNSITYRVSWNFLIYIYSRCSPQKQLPWNIARALYDK